MLGNWRGGQRKVVCQLICKSGTFRTWPGSILPRCCGCRLQLACAHRQRPPIVSALCARRSVRKHSRLTCYRQPRKLSETMIDVHDSFLSATSAELLAQAVSSKWSAGRRRCLGKGDWRPGARFARTGRWPKESGQKIHGNFFHTWDLPWGQVH